ncbi:MAG: NAD/NADP octopine/nopaline dehydrogenase family protein [Alphaproteobacteria bacterium]|nr:NAD/NADP octopine/nopaline dehydrogenase family protein [Alphaproteobacteria bacterium]
MPAPHLQQRWASGYRHTQIYHKFITEDVPTGLIPMSALGSAAGVRTPAIDALVELGKIMTGDDFAATARTLDRLGLSGMDTPQIRRVVDQGFG